MEKKKSSKKLNIAIIHPDLGIGGAERLIVDAAVELVSHGHNVHVFTAHHDRTRCFEETLGGQNSVCWIVVKVLFYCHFPDLLLAQHSTLLRRIYRKPIDFVEEITTGMADLILVNSKFTSTTFANTFKRLCAREIFPAVLYPAVNVDQFDEPRSNKLNFLSVNRFERKKNIDLALSAFVMLQNLEGDHKIPDVTLTIAGKSFSFMVWQISHTDYWPCQCAEIFHLGSVCPCNSDICARVVITFNLTIVLVTCQKHVRKVCPGMKFL
ncbi:hypothetical protein Pint_04758 [Pistacia integerrima]|uniref:Uncharacterized protein n=1 Tax=Pistacia integerrima TaxID=434235 RepID=A0ACC0Z8Z7_9ROSI|nr:hypothetical protein Pint_04758 [Pistacia integerrima]